MTRMRPTQDGGLIQQAGDKCLAGRFSVNFSLRRKRLRTCLVRSQEDDVPQLKGDWRDFRAGLVSSSRKDSSFFHPWVSLILDTMSKRFSSRTIKVMVVARYLLIVYDVTTFIWISQGVLCTLSSSNKELLSCDRRIKPGLVYSSCEDLCVMESFDSSRIVFMSKHFHASCFRWCWVIHIVEFHWCYSVYSFYHVTSFLDDISAWVSSSLGIFDPINHLELSPRCDANLNFSSCVKSLWF